MRALALATALLALAGLATAAPIFSDQLFFDDYDDYNDPVAPAAARPAAAATATAQPHASGLARALSSVVSKGIQAAPNLFKKYKETTDATRTRHAQDRRTYITEKAKSAEAWRKSALRNKITAIRSVSAHHARRQHSPGAATTASLQPSTSPQVLWTMGAGAGAGDTAAVPLAASPSAPPPILGAFWLPASLSTPLALPQSPAMPVTAST